MAKIAARLPRIRTLDTRVAKPPPKRADPELLTTDHRRWREQVIARADYRCEAIENGKRCETAAPARLFADHIVERKDGGALTDVSNGQCLCGRHHTLKTTQARAERLAARS